MFRRIPGKSSKKTYGNSLTIDIESMEGNSGSKSVTLSGTNTPYLSSCWPLSVKQFDLHDLNHALPITTLTQFEIETSLHYSIIYYGIKLMEPFHTQDYMKIDYG